MGVKNRETTGRAEQIVGRELGAAECFDLRRRVNSNVRQ
jgi:hypothetical protein